MPKDIHSFFAKIGIGRFTFLLISIVLMFTLRPFLENFIGISILVDIFFTLILISGIYAVSPTKRIFRVAMVIAFPALLISWSDYFLEVPFLNPASEIFGGIFYVFMVVIIISYLFKEKQITTDVIAGAVCAYFMLGMMWASIYAILEFLRPGSFDIPQSLHGESSPFTYYSYITLTTLGYGDITPISSEARSFSLLEAITGQIYLATLVARLVSMNIMQSMKKESP